VVNQCQVAIIIPVFFEHETISKVLTDINDALTEKARVYLIADSESDPTLDVARVASKGHSYQLSCLVQNGAAGPTEAIKLGLNIAREPFLVLMTGDDSDSPRDIPRLISILRNGADLAVASRYTKGGQHLNGPALKHFLSWLAGWLLKTLKGIGTNDPTNLYKAVSRDFLSKITIESRYGFTLGLELVAKVNSFGGLIMEAPTIWQERTTGHSNFKMFRWLPTYLYWFIRVLRS